MYAILKFTVFFIFNVEMAFSFVLKSPLIAQKYDVALFKDAFFVGKSLRLSLKPYECTNLPNQFLNHTSSILTNGCVVIFPDFDCQSTNKQIFSNINFDFYEFFYSAPDEIPNYDFTGSW